MIWYKNWEPPWVLSRRFWRVHAIHAVSSMLPWRRFRPALTRATEVIGWAQGSAVFYWVQLSQVELLTVVVLFVAFCCFMQAFREFVQVASTTCRDSRLGIFKMECSHHTNKSISESCQHLGTAKTWHKLAAESLLGQYEKQLSKIVSKWPGIELSTR